MFFLFAVFKFITRIQMELNENYSNEDHKNILKSTTDSHVLRKSHRLDGLVQVPTSSNNLTDYRLLQTGKS